MLSQVLGLTILDTDGHRIAAKYTLPCLVENLKDFSSQTKFESQLFQKATKLTARNEAEVILADDCVVLMRGTNDVLVFVIGPEGENELILAEVVNAVYGTLSNLTNNQIGRRQLFENLDTVYLMMDEVVDGGVVFEIDAATITARVQMSSDTVPQEASEPTAFNQALNTAKENIMRSFLSAS